MPPFHKTCVSRLPGQKLAVAPPPDAEAASARWHGGSPVLLRRPGGSAERARNLSRYRSISLRRCVDSSFCMPSNIDAVAGKSLRKFSARSAVDAFVLFLESDCQGKYFLLTQTFKAAHKFSEPARRADSTGHSTVLPPCYPTPTSTPKHKDLADSTPGIPRTDLPPLCGRLVLQWVWGLCDFRSPGSSASPGLRGMLLVFRSRRCRRSRAITAIPPPPPGFVLVSIANKDFVRIHASVALARRLGGPWATLGPPNPRPNPKPGRQGRDQKPCGAKPRCPSDPERRSVPSPIAGCYFQRACAPWRCLKIADSLRRINCELGHALHPTPPGTFDIGNRPTLQSSLLPTPGRAACFLSRFPSPFGGVAQVVRATVS